MSKRRSQPTRSQSTRATSAAAPSRPPKDQHSESPDSLAVSLPEVPMPHPRLRIVISVALVAHLAAIAISFAAAVEPSQVHSRLVDLLLPYFQLTHFGADDRPVYLAHGEKSEQPHRMEWTASDHPGENDWIPLLPASTPGLAVSDRLHRYLAKAASLADAEKSSVVANLIMPVVRFHPDTKLVRIIRLPTELTTIIDDAAPPPYIARVIHVDPAPSVDGANDNRIEVIRIHSPRLVTAPAP